MKRVLDKLQVNYLLYKIIGVILISGYLYVVNTTYFDLPKYGNYPFYIMTLFLCSLFMVLPSILDKIIASVAIIFYSVYVIFQVCYCKMFEQYLFIQSALSLYEEAAAYTSDGLAMLTATEIKLLLLGMAIIFCLVLVRKKRTKDNFKWALISALIAIVGFSGVFILYNKEVKVIESTNVDLFKYHESDHYIYDKINPKKTFVDYFGIELFFYRDIKDNWLIDNNLIQEGNEKVSDFLANNLPYQENEYTGLLEGKHLLMIEGESLNMAAIDPILTPTLYKIIHEGWYFENFYSPLLTGSTSDVETMVNTSLIPINDGTIVSQSYAENTYPTTLAKGFKSAGYLTSVVHNNYKVYYNRENYFETLGYDTFLDSFGLGVENQSSDYICGQILNWIPVFNDKDFTFWITYSGHQPYALSSLSDENQYPLAVQKEYEEYLKEVKSVYPELDESVQFYLAKNMSLDRAVEEYIRTYEMMEQESKLVIVIYGDHYAKGFSSEAHEQVKQYLNRSLSDTPLALWYPGIETMTIEKYCTDIDIMPTLFNLYNINYDKQTILGNDIFDERYHGFQFTTTWVISTDNFTYSLETGSFLDLKVSKEEANQELKRYLEYQEISNLIFKNDYFAIGDNYE